MEDLDTVALKLRYIARRRARRFARKTDWEALAEDCETEGWIGYLRAQARGVPEWVWWSEAVHAMTDAIVQWLYGASEYNTRQQYSSTRIPLMGINLGTRSADDPRPEQLAMAHDLEIKLRRRLDSMNEGSVSARYDIAAYHRVLDDAILDGTSELRAGRKMGMRIKESERVVRGRRIRRIREITTELLN